MSIGTYTKSIVALVGFILTTAITLDWGFEFPRWVPALSTLLTAVGVFAFPNKPYVELPDDAEEQRRLARRDDTDPL